MHAQFLPNLSRDLSQILGDSDDYNVMIEVGQGDESQTFRAHSVLLRARSPYFRSALSSEWVRKDAESITATFKKPNVTPTVFEIILKYIYTGSVELATQDPTDILDLLIACDELLLDELFTFVEDFIVLEKFKWVQKNVLPVYTRIYHHESCSKLKEFCLGTLCKQPLLIFGSDDYLSFHPDLLLPLIARDDLQMDEVELWDNLLKWGIAQNIELDSGITNWTNEDFATLGRTLSNFFPLVRFALISTSDFYDKVWPFYRALPEECLDDIMKFYFKRECHKPESRITTARTIPFDSAMIRAEHAACVADWIDRKDGNGYTFNEMPYRFRLLLRGSIHGFSAETFHERCDHQGPTIVILKVRGEDIIGGYNPLEWTTGDTHHTTQNSFLFSFGSRGNLADAKLSRVTRSGYAIRVKDRTFGPCFGDKDLWMKGKFNEEDSCTSEKDDYADSVISYSKFCADEYEVFQIVKK